jgi:ribonuclease III
MVDSCLADLEQALGYRFLNPGLAEQALTHSSVATERESSGLGSNEQLEYLGDAILEMLVSEYLFTAYPDWSEGQLSKGRARLVNAAALASAARRLGLGGHLRLGRGEEKTGGREKPALLGDAFEAVVAAIYLDAGLPAAREFVIRTLIDVSRESQASELGFSDHKSALQEFLQARTLPGAIYEVVRESGPDHRKTFWVEVSVPGSASATGAGATKKEAEQLAAEQALVQLQWQLQSAATIGKRISGGGK